MDDKSAKKPIIVSTHDVHLDKDYIQWIHSVKERFRNTQIKASVKVNSELLFFYWCLGKDLVTRKMEEQWGSGIVEQVSLDLQDAFPDCKGFSTTNLWYMKKWYMFYSGGDITKLQQLVGEIESQLSGISPRLDHIGKSIDNVNISDELPFPSFFSYVPWGHHTVIVTKCHSIEEALFYVCRIIKDGWSRNTLQDFIKSDLFGRTGTAITNFDSVLPTIHGKLAQEITKDTYDLGFITLPPNYDEGDLEDALERNII